MLHSFNFAFILLALATTGCASIIDGTSQTISIDSNPPHASCQLINNGRVVGNVQTPGRIVVEKTKYDINITCEKEGYQAATATLTSEIEDSTWGNIILGGGIGWAIDSASGADNSYADQLTVTLVPAGAVPTGDVPTGDVPINAAVLAPPLAATWRSVSNNVLAFSESDDSGGSISMPSHVELVLVEGRGEWGLFEYQSGGDMRAQAWIALKEVIQEQ